MNTIIDELISKKAAGIAAIAGIKVTEQGVTAVLEFFDGTTIGPLTRNEWGPDADVDFLQQLWDQLRGPEFVSQSFDDFAHAMMSPSTLKTLPGEWLVATLQKA